MRPDPDRQPADTSQLMPIGRVVETVRRAHHHVTPSSLRFLEREGLVVPTRTPGGHRLYSTADVRRIVQIKEWQAQRRSLQEIREMLRRQDALPDRDSLTRSFLEQVLAGEVDAARRTILAADDLGVPLEELFGEVIEPALVEIGRGWQHGTVLVAQEKTVSELVRDLIAELSLRHTVADPAGPRVIAACVAGERHELGLRMLIGLLRADGYRVQYLGADVASGFLADAVRLHAPDAVLLSARFDASEPALVEAIAAVRDAAPPDGAPIVLVGGHIVRDRRERIAALGAIPVISERVPDAMQTLREALPPIPRSPSEGTA